MKKVYLFPKKKAQKLNDLTFQDNKKIQIASPQDNLKRASDLLLDNQAKELCQKVAWLVINGLSKDPSEVYPVAISGKGEPILMLHGFDSSFLEYRRLAPFLEQKYQIIIPDLYGFGFCPRPIASEYGIEEIINHLVKLLSTLEINSRVGIIGASMGGGIGIEFAKRYPTKVSKLLLLSPAGIIGKPKPIKEPLDKLGVWFLKQKFVRRQLCRQAFANPARDVGPAEEQIASIHLEVPGWGRSLSAFARKGGIANCGETAPTQTTKIIWGAQDRILSKKLRSLSNKALNLNFEEIEDCGHLPHIDRAEYVAQKWIEQ